MAANSAIRKPSLKPNPQRVRFSLQYLQLDHTKFAINNCTREFLEAFLRQVFVYQAWTLDAFREIESSAHRHQIFFEDTSEMEGFKGIDPSDENLWTEEAWQFALPGTRGDTSSGWRVHGFIANDTFYVVWLDPNHLLDSGQRITPDI